MLVTLIRPPIVGSENALGVDVCPPLGLAYLAGNLERAGHQVQIIDAVGEAIYQFKRYKAREDFPTAILQGLSYEDTLDRVPRDVELIGVTSMFSLEWPYIREFIGMIRERFPEVPIVAGGEHISACPKYSMLNCPGITFSCLGEGEDTIVELADALEQETPITGVKGLAYRVEDRIEFTPYRDRIQQIDQIAPPAWHLVPVHAYLEQGIVTGINLGRTMPMLASRGCPYQCTFCSSPAMWTTRWEARSPESVLEEMIWLKNTYQVSNFELYDLTAIVRKDWISKMAHLIIDRGLDITWQLPSGTRSEALDAEISALLYKSGCRHISYSPESGSEEVLKNIKKKIKKSAMLDSMRGAVKNGLTIKSNFIFGFPGEKLRHILESYVFMIQHAWVGVHDISAYQMAPYPGSELFRELKKNGQIELSDSYFFSLSQYTDHFVNKSYSKHLPGRLLGVLCLTGMALFFAVSFTLRPQRVWQAARNLLRDAPKTKFENALHRYFKKKRTAQTSIPIQPAEKKEMAASVHP